MNAIQGIGAQRPKRLRATAGSKYGLKVSPQRKLHIVQGDHDLDRKDLEKSARKRSPTSSWIVPKRAAVGDDVVIYVPSYGFFATANINSEPKPRSDWKNRYGASLADVRLISPPISLGTIRQKILKLTWATYPRSITTAAPRIAARIRSLIQHRRRTGLPELDDKSLNEANLAELRKAALLGSRSKVQGRTRSAVTRIRSRAIRLYVLRRANGRCEGCGLPGPFRTIDSHIYLEPHHTHRLADGGPDHPSRVIALCPNCHRRAHYSEDARVFNRSLIKRLMSLEKR